MIDRPPFLLCASLVVIDRRPVIVRHRCDRRRLARRMTGLLALTAIGLWSVRALAADGDVDSSFGLNGRATFKMTNGISVPKAIALDSTQRLVVAGSATSYSGGSPAFMLMRALPDGARDTSFAVDQAGFRTYAFALSGIGGYSEDEARSVLLQSDGRIVAAGTAKFSTSYSHMAALRVDDAGVLDPGFGQGGATHFGLINAERSAVRSAALDGSNRIVLAGAGSYRQTGSTADETHVQVARLTPSGLLDSAFASFGAADFNFAPVISAGYGDSVLIVATGASSAITVGGYTSGPELLQGALLRLNTAGVLQAGYGNSGIVVLDSNVDHVGAVVPLANGQLMVGGGSRNGANQTELFLARLDVDGTLDPSFGVGGITRLPAPSARGAILLARTKSGGWLYVASDGFYGFVLARFNAVGRPDLAFGNGGGLHIYFDEADSVNFVAVGAVLTAEGKLIVCGAMPENAANGDADFGLMRILADYETLFVDGFDSDS